MPAKAGIHGTFIRGGPRPAPGRQRSPLLPRHLAVAVDVAAHDEAEADEGCDHRRAAVGDHRQGNPHYGDQTHRHRDIDEDVEREIHGQADGEIAPEIMTAAQSDPQYQPSRTGSWPTARAA